MARPEITGRKVGATAGPAKQNPAKLEAADDEPPKQLAMSIRDFCQRHDISYGLYFKLKQAGKGPDEMRLGTRITISHEAASRWRAEREADTEAAESAAKAWVEARKPKPEPDRPKLQPKLKRKAKLAAEAGA